MFVSFLCVSNQAPFATFKIILIAKSRQSFVEMAMTILKVSLPQLSDVGLYTCVATSSSGETSWSAYLDVRGLSQ